MIGMERATEGWTKLGKGSPVGGEGGLLLPLLFVGKQSEGHGYDSYAAPKSDCIHHIPIDLESNERPFGSKAIAKW